MKILFIIPSFELGKDGVADYTATLSLQCASLGHSVSVLAWNDPYLKENRQNFSLEKEGLSIPSLRLSSHAPHYEKHVWGKEFVHDQTPDLISLQMVCFGFHPRGWIFGLGKSLKKIIPKQVSVHILFHELWLGLAKNHPWKEKLTGFIQKTAMKQCWEALRPACVHVGNNVYYSKLLPLGLPVKYLPLPSNIPYQANENIDWIYLSLSMEKQKRQQSLVFVFFGTIHSGWDFRSFWKQMQNLGANRQIYAVSVGGMGYGAPLWDQMGEEFARNIQFIRLGFQSEDRISNLLKWADAGISTTPLSLLGKSGSAMAMVEHGLPIIVTRNELNFDFPILHVEDAYPQVFLWEQLHSLGQLKRVLPQTNRTGRIAGKFLEDVSLPPKEIVS